MDGSEQDLHITKINYVFERGIHLENWILERMLWLRSRGVALHTIGEIFKAFTGLKAEAIEQRLTRFHERYRN